MRDSARLLRFRGRRPTQIALLQGKARERATAPHQDMNLTLRLDPGRLRVWHVRLAERLARRNGVRLAVEFIDSGTSFPSSLEFLFSLERLIYGIAVDDITL